MRLAVPKGAGLAERGPATPPLNRVSRPRPELGKPSLSELEFPGCYARPMTLAQFQAHGEHDGRIEFFDSSEGLAWLACEPPHHSHEDPLNMLGRLLERIALMRGSPIVCRGAADIHLHDPDTGEVRVIQPDQTVYLHPGRLDRTGPLYLTVGEDPLPDVVLEVDNTTDVRRNRLKLYEAWGFPEVWVEVPAVYSRSRPRGLSTGLTIYLLKDGGYAPSAASRAFPGWRAAEIHAGLNDWVISDETSEVLSRVGRALGEREGTGPENDPLLRRHRAEGRAAGVAEGRADLVRALLASRGIELPAGFPGRQERALLARASAEDLLAAASAADSLADFLARLDKPSS